MNAIAMLEKCAGNSLLGGASTYRWEMLALSQNCPHSQLECETIARQLSGPNLVLWNGRAHALVLQLKD